MNDCPSQAQLAELLTGASGEPVRVHVSGCEPCRRRLLELEADEALLDELRAARSVTAASAPRDARTLPGAPDSALEPEPHAAAGDRFPGYEVLEWIDRGGQGVVLKALQLSTRRTVALKILGGRGFAGLRQRQRFQREVELVGRLQHRNIVTVFDSGVSERGRDFYVMQYIAGEPLDRYIERTPAERRPIRAALELFLKIAAAVQYAHERGVIHRDLKPGNILLDDSGEPCVLDFGLAKLVDPSAGTAGDVTLSGDFVGTLAYASPEQTLGNPADIDIRADVYSLGAILYELLTGRRAQEVSGSLADAVERIRSADPAPPGRIRRGINDELDTIVLTALRKDRARRYATVDALARDIRRYLAGEAIDAKRDSGLYVLRKTLRRYRVPVALAAAFVLLVLAFGVSMLLLARQARTAEQAAIEARRAAEKQLARATQIQRLLEGALKSVQPERARTRDVTLLREVLDEAARRIDVELAGQPEVELELRTTIATTYLRAGLYPDAEFHARRALELQELTLGNHHPALADTLVTLSIALREQARTTEAEDAAQRAVAILRAADPPREEGLIGALGALAFAVRKQGRAAESEPIYREAHEVALRCYDSNAIPVAMTAESVANVLRDLGRHDESERLYRSALAILDKHLAPDHYDLAQTNANLGLLLASRGRYAEAEPLLRQALDGQRRWLGDQHPATIETLSGLATLLLARGEVAAAEPLGQQAVDALRTLGAGARTDLAYALHTLGVVHYRLKNYEAAERDLREALALRRELLPEHRFTAMSAGELGRCLTALQRHEQAEPLLLEAYNRLSTLLGPEHAFTRSQAERLVRLYDAWGRPESAARYRAALEPAPADR